MKRLYAAAWLATGLLTSTGVTALTPLSPHLTPQSHQELTARLTELGFPQVGHNSVVIALTQALGFKAESKTYDYHERHAHLPRVQVHVTPDSAGCAVVALQANYQLPQPGSVQLQGLYCLSGMGQWQARQQVLTPAP
ncbi:hypothetical protein HZ993_11145 [Rhodoferax sp. AJA081-3]|uniref:hypothetical protein n=1 Tax=Rhodoferax sp. AJA081-3 TaxID=2752316 RepID=UPI001AE02E9C|nr:hypothetical protein [Rhodoferax sp. AJA081-3]QTN30301.1 hypothetical protein HZ993_11145 [Rhodoferax sp. AJA081-3]